MARWLFLSVLGLGCLAAQEGRPPAPPPARDPALQDFIHYLIARFDHPNPILRRAVRAALIAVGKPAEPALLALQKEAPAESPRARAVQQILRRIRQAGRARAAEGKPRWRRHPEARIRQIATRLHIPEEKVPELLRLVRGHREALRDLRRRGLGEREARAERRRLARVYLEQLRELLGPDKAREFVRALRRPGRGRARPGDRPPF